MNSILNTEETLAVLTNNIKNWPYESKEYSIKDIVFNGIKYDVDQSVKFEKKGEKSYLKNGNNIVEVPYKFSKLTKYILETKSVNNKSLFKTFENTPTEIIEECIESLKKMRILH